MLINLLRLFFGFVEFEATGGFPERFINLCTVNGITLWQVQNNGVKVNACTSLGGYKNIRKSARKSGMHVRVIKKRGLPFFIKNNKARAGVLVGVFLAAVFLFFSSCVLWNVEVSGNERVKTEVLLEALEENGVKVGVIKSKVETVEVAESILKENKELSWVSLNIFGTKAVLEVKENTEKPKVIEKEKSTNLVAAKDGQIVLVEGHNGTNAVKEGNVVVKGDLLISGVLKNADGSEKTVRAMGKVFAKTQTTVKAEAWFENEISVLKETENKNYLYALGVKIPMFVKCRGVELYNGKTLLKSNGEELPFGIKWDVLGDFSQTTTAFTENQALLLALTKSVEKKRENCKGECETEKISYTAKTTESGVEVDCVITARENIAVEKEIFLEKN